MTHSQLETIRKRAKKRSDDPDLVRARRDVDALLEELEKFHQRAQIFEAYGRVQILDALLAKLQPGAYPEIRELHRWARDTLELLEPLHEKAKKFLSGMSWMRIT